MRVARRVRRNATQLAGTDAQCRTVREDSRGYGVAEWERGLTGNAATDVRQSVAQNDNPYQKA